MRFSPGCVCCGGTSYPTGCASCPTLPDRLFVTLTMACAGYSGDVVEVNLSGVSASQVSYLGDLPASCGSSSLYQSATGCDNPHLDRLFVGFECQSGTPRVTVQLGCAASGGFAGAAPVGQAFFSCPGDLSPVDLAVTMGDAGTFTGACCEDQLSPSGTATITE